MRNDQASENGRNFMLGLLCGTAVGAAIALLLAPKSGAELRQQLAESAERLRRQADETYQRAAGAMDEVVKQGRHAVRLGQEKFAEARTQFSEEARADL